MSAYSLTKTRFKEGVWEGLLSAATSDAPPPEITVDFDGHPVRGVTVTETDATGRWALAVPVPQEALCDGVQTFAIREAASDAVLGSFTLIAGKASGEDLRAEVSLLRAELDMLKRAFRRHCLETM